uniref:Uncharacterized protein n=1 Tax=Tetraselmis sp. GSL018 TaxID=582737 RepID=A0A061RY71_9CHLO
MLLLVLRGRQRHRALGVCQRDCPRPEVKLARVEAHKPEQVLCQRKLSAARAFLRVADPDVLPSVPQVVDQEVDEGVSPEAARRGVAEPRLEEVGLEQEAHRAEQRQLLDTASATGRRAWSRGSALGTRGPPGPACRWPRR